MVKPLFDSCILIDYLIGQNAASAELGRWPTRAISLISWMEVMTGATAANSDQTRQFLSRFDVIEIDQSIAEAAVKLRAEHRLRLPDAIIWASASVSGRILVTRDAHFPADDPGIRFPYAL